MDQRKPEITILIINNIRNANAETIWMNKILLPSPVTPKNSNPTDEIIEIIRKIADPISILDSVEYWGFVFKYQRIKYPPSISPITVWNRAKYIE